MQTQRFSPARSSLLSLLLMVLIGSNVGGWLLWGPPRPAAAQAPAPQDAATIEIIGHNFQSFPNYAIDFRVKDQYGRDITGLQKQDIRLVEDGKQTITAFEFQPSEQTSEAEPKRTVQKPSDGQEYTFYAKGAAIGIVFDATTLLDKGAPPGTSFLAMGREAIMQFLDHTRASPERPEVFSLFFPMDNPATQQIQPDEFATFTHDRGGLKNYLQNMTPRTDKTQLYAAVQKAVVATAEAALQQSSEAVVLVVSDGGDAISGDAFNEITEQARERGVTLITFGFGTDEALENNEFRLSQLAEITDGVYRRKPDAQAVKEAFEKVVQVTPSGFYSVRYETELLEDDSQHTVRIEVGNARSQEISFVPTRGANGSESDLKPLRNVLLWKYFIFALPASLLVSLIITLMMGGIKVAKSRSLSRDRTRR